MIADLMRFAFLNLGASLVAGAAVAGTVLGVSHLLGIRDARLRSWLLGAALVKSTLVLAGLAGLLHSAAAGALHVEPLPPSLIGPLVAVWAGGWLLLRGSLLRSLREGAESTRPERSGTAAVARLRASVGRVSDATRRLERIDGRCFSCAVPDDLPTPAARVTQSSRPATLDPAGDPIIEIPETLLGELDDAELDAVVAHELGHVLVARDRGVCAPLWARVARLTSPSAALIGGLLDREEELACDELAVRVTGHARPLASALLKTYRLRRSRMPALAPVANLVGRSRLLRDRVVRLSAAEADLGSPAGLRVAAACAVTVLVTVAL